MTVLLFEYGHSKINTWDKKWSGEGKVFAKEVFLTTKKRGELYTRLHQPQDIVFR